MKNIAIPLLASSVHAQTAADLAKAAATKPILIADTWVEGGCTDDDVAAAKTALSNADAAWTTENDKLPALIQAETDAHAVVGTTRAAFIAKMTEVASVLADDDGAIDNLLTNKQALDAATDTETANIAAASAANTALDAAQDALDAALLVQSQTDTAASAALNHYTAEQESTAQLIIDRDAAEAAHGLVAADEANLQSLYDTAKGTSDGTQLTTDARLTAKNDHIATKTQLDADVVLATAAINAATDPSVAKTKADEESTLSDKQGDLDTTRDAWIAKANATVKAMKNWLLAENYTAVGNQTDGCSTSAPSANSTSGNYNGANGTDNGTGATGDCADICSALPAWGMAANLPTGGSMVSGGTGADFSATHCYGYSFSTNNTACLLMQESPLTQGGRGDDYSCLKRDKSEFATPLVTAIADGIASGGTEYDAMIADLGEWETQQNVVLAAVGAYNMANEYKALLDTIASDQNTLASDATTSYGIALGTSDGNNATTATKLQNLTDKQSEIATAKAAWDALIALVTSQTAEEAAQLAIKELADTAKAGQDTEVNNLTTARDDANTAKGLADTASSDATSAKDTAQTAYTEAETAQVATAAAVEGGVGELATLKTAYDEALEARSNASDAIDAIVQDTETEDADGNVTPVRSPLNLLQDDVDAKRAAHLLAVVKCKETDYDAYFATFETNVATRETNLLTIADLIAANVPPAAGSGVINSRCEKAPTNMASRPSLKDGGGCNEGLCCGEIRIPEGNHVMIQEYCYTVGTTYPWVAARKPMETEMPAPVNKDFRCIDGAKNLAAAASALAAAVYMLA